MKIEVKISFVCKKCRGHRGVKTPDYRWNGKLWELKTIESAKAADGAIRRALKQINKNPGGVFLDFKGNEVDEKVLLDIITNRMTRKSGSGRIGDIFVVSDSSYKVYRFK